MYKLKYIGNNFIKTRQIERINFYERNANKKY